ncbi:MAG: bifunctional (p)ppGpp synthetase/guanosine-3',5'-bis(diphosphate) 3'-pyrophosphohydrolase [Candidatus Magasanikbacteria bacterium]|nr:bifunctional (p)ppGpp synthetase/guanosine-3',5'-bis(diphosphate) 3'-pyrophosphohydrolase [Candidatus Magasanikbacteria bacterium]
MPYKDIIPTNPNITDLMEQIKTYYRKQDTDMVRLAYDFAEKAHRGQFRKSGEPYIIHPVATAMILARMRIDPNIIVAALLHDVPEDTSVTLEEIEKNFGPDIAGMIRGITKLGKLKYRGVERYIENLRKMFVAMAEDIRVMIIKFADRVHNLSTLDALPPKKKHRIALESLEIYAPIANRLGIGEFKGLLEDLSFPHILPKEYEKTEELRKTLVSEREVYLQNVMEIAKSELKNAGIDVLNVHGREKTLYSLYRKIMAKGGWENAEQIYDVVAIRIIVNSVSDCYAALGIIHKLWRPLKGRIKDYISQPKPNGYQSLHTTVFCVDGKIVEFQIRDKSMHDEAEYGIAAHWHYDERGARLPAKDIFWAKELADIQKNILEKLSDIDELKVDFFKNRIFVFTPKGDVIDLPEDATPIDFAYHIHTDIGNQCNGAKINDQLVSLDTPLKSGDVIEVFTDKNRKGPSQDWLKHVKTHQAKSKIKEKLKTEKGKWLKIIMPRTKK